MTNTSVTPPASEVNHPADLSFGNYLAIINASALHVLENVSRRDLLALCRKLEREGVINADPADPSRVASLLREHSDIRDVDPIILSELLHRFQRARAAVRK